MTFFSALASTLSTGWQGVMHVKAIVESVDGDSFAVKAGSSGFRV